MAKSKLEKALEARATECIEAFNACSSAFFDFFADDATVFSAGSVEPQLGRKAYQKFFEPKLKSEKRELKVLDRLVQLTGERAIIAQTCQVNMSGIVANIRQTAIWVLNDEIWVIQHLHSTLIGTPAPESPPRRASAIRILNERIATVAAVVGVAQ